MDVIHVLNKALLFVSFAVTWTHPINVTVGHSVLLPCQVNFSTQPIDLKNLSVWWQDNNDKVLFSYDEGKVWSTNQDNLYTNRTTASENNLAFGNISIKMEDLTIQDNSKDICAYYREHIDEELVKCVCESTLFVAGTDKFPLLQRLNPRLYQVVADVF